MPLFEVVKNRSVGTLFKKTCAIPNEIISKRARMISKIIFVLGSYESLICLEGKTMKDLFF